MISIIGVMIGIYIITRMISFITRKDERAESSIVIVFAVITIFVTFFCIIDLLVRGLDFTP